MSAAAARRFRMLWIAAIAALGIGAAWPDAGGTEDKSAQTSLRLRLLPGIANLQPFAAPVMPLFTNAHPVEAAAVDREDAAAARGVSAVSPLPTAARIPGVARHSHHPQNMQHPHIAQNPQSAQDSQSSPHFSATPRMLNAFFQAAAPYSENAPQQQSPLDSSSTPRMRNASSPAVAPYPENAPQQQSPNHPASMSAPGPDRAQAGPSMPETPRHAESDVEEPAMYVVTAHYLNVRAEPDKTSPIYGLLERGDRVSVVGKTDNGWLRLENGLYIHGAYAEPDASAGSPSEPAKNAGREVAIASASAPAKPKPAAYRPESRGGRASGGPAPLSKKVKSSSGMTKEDIAMLLKGTDLEGHGLEEAILGIEEEHGINALFTIAVMKLESGNGKSKLAREKNNLFGLNATGGKSKAYRFETKSDSVYKFGSIIAKGYLAKGYSTIEKVGEKYCPANPKWASLIENIMKRDHRKLVGAAV